MASAPNSRVRAESATGQPRFLRWQMRAHCDGENDHLISALCRVAVMSPLIAPRQSAARGNRLSRWVFLLPHCSDHPPLEISVFESASTYPSMQLRLSPAFLFVETAVPTRLNPVRIFFSLAGCSAPQNSQRFALAGMRASHSTHCFIGASPPPSDLEVPGSRVHSLSMSTGPKRRRLPA